MRDGRTVKVHRGDYSREVRLRVTRAARAAIRKKNSFSLCLSGGSIAGMLKGLPTNLAYFKWHIFMAEEKIGENRTYNDIMNSFALDCKIPLENIHRVHVEKNLEDAVFDYEKVLRLHPSLDNKDAGCPHVDLIVLGAGVKGRVARLLPDSKEVQTTGQGNQAVLGVQKENSLTVSMDFIRAANSAIICASGLKRSPMVETALTRSFYKYECPAGLVYSNRNKIFWMVDLEALTHYRAWWKRNCEIELRNMKAKATQVHEIK